MGKMPREASSDCTGDMSGIHSIMSSSSLSYDCGTGVGAGEDDAGDDGRLRVSLSRSPGDDESCGAVAGLEEGDAVR
jgi:hypothetical protein